MEQNAFLLTFVLHATNGYHKYVHILRHRYASCESVLVLT